MEGALAVRILGALWQCRHYRALWGGADGERALELGSNSYPCRPLTTPGAHEHLWAGLRGPADLGWPRTAGLGEPQTATDFPRTAGWVSYGLCPRSPVTG